MKQRGFKINGVQRLMFGKKIVRLLVLAATVFLFGCASYAPPALAQSKPSFDCKRATGALQKIICGNAELAALDANLATVYAARRAALDRVGQAALDRNQKAWIGARAKSCAPPALRDESPADCLRESYQHRLSALNGVCETGEYTVYEMANSKTPWSKTLPLGFKAKPDVQVYRNTDFVMNNNLPSEDLIAASSAGEGMPCCGAERLMTCRATGPRGEEWLVSTDGKTLFYALANNMEPASTYDARVKGTQGKK